MAVSGAHPSLFHPMLRQKKLFVVSTNQARQAGLGVGPLGLRSGHNCKVRRGNNLIHFAFPPLVRSFPKGLNQKATRAPSCNSRIGWALDICPKVVVPAVAAGAFQLAMLNTFNASPRSCKFTLSPSLKVRKIARSTSR